MENPRNSYFWLIMSLFTKQHSWMKQLWDSLTNNDHLHVWEQVCKWTTIRATPQPYDVICKACDKSHPHESWKPTLGPSGPSFPTTTLAEYTKELCSEMASCVANFLVNKGVSFVDTSLTDQTAITPRQWRVHGKKQLPPLLAEYWLVCDQTMAQQFPYYKPLTRLPPTCEKGGVMLAQTGNEFSEKCKKLESDYAVLSGTVFAATTTSDKVSNWFGVLRCPLQTIDATANMKHPMNINIPLPDLLLRAVATVLQLGPGVVADRRVFHCNRILQRIKELEPEERKLHETLRPQVAAVLKGKKLLIWRELLVETGFPDLEIYDEVLEGIKLVGLAFQSGAFPSELTPAQQLVSQQCASSLEEKSINWKVQIIWRPSC